jgi:nucleotide-binding universal stress UspA family protein
MEKRTWRLKLGLSEPGFPLTVQTSPGRALKEQKLLPFKKILCPTDFSEPSYDALKAAGEMALHFGAELVVIHVIPPVPVQYPYPDPPVASSFDVALYQQELAISAENALKGVVAQRVSPKVRTLATVVTGDPAGEIVGKAQDENADLVIIATHGLTGWRHLVFGSVAEKVVRTAACPVLTIREPRKAEG